jgi:hypothetical protein
MSKLIRTIFLSMLIVLFLNGCNSGNEEKDIFQYKESYIGDNAAIGNIVEQLQSSEHLEGFELKTNEEPYGVTLNYDWLDSEQAYQETVVHNATFIFALVKNADWVTFHFEDKEYQITKANLQDWYGKDLSEFTSEDELVKLIEDTLKNEEKVQQLFS